MSKHAAYGQDFRNALRQEFDHYLTQESQRYPDDECLRVDLHCHDKNSDVPDELWGRLLGLPETWLKTSKLVKCLKSNGSDVITVTNHNNARSCWKLLDKGHDVLVGCEFTCLFPEYDLYLHVLTYGFSPEQEVQLNKKRHNIYNFVRYAAEQDIPLILPHPLYFYTRHPNINLDMFEKLALMFMRFEVLNAQRDLWHSVLVLNWARSLTPEKLRSYARKHRLEPAEFGVDIAKAKSLTGGSDDHMGLSAGLSGSRLWVPHLAQRRQSESLSTLALNALRANHIAPFGHVAENQKLGIALLDYFAQVTTRIEDPGLLRMVLHRGEIEDKLACFAIANGLLEMKKHKKTRKFIGFVHDALHGKKPGRLVRWNVSNDYRFCVDELVRVADSRHSAPEDFHTSVDLAVSRLFTGLNKLIIQRARDALGEQTAFALEDFSAETLTRKFEVPVHLRELLSSSAPRQKNMSGINLRMLVDNLSFPVMIGAVLAGSQFASTRALYQNRNFLNQFAQHIGHNRHQNRALYLTDTLLDRNGVSRSLSGKLAEIQRQNHPVDFLICHPDAQAAEHLHVLKPLTEFSFPSLGEQEFRIPDLLEIARLFYQGGYDRLICSTEGPMVLVSLFLKHMFNVPSYFFMHTDWMDFVRHTTNLDAHERDRIRRLLRALYQQFDGVFVLNTEHQNWLTGHEIGLDPDKVHLTAHHVEPLPTAISKRPKSSWIKDCDDDAPVLFVACRISKEKGILELPEIYRKARLSLPNLRIVIAGTGPAASELQAALPEATYLGWVDAEQMQQLYASLDLFVFPSKFDTFGNVVLEAFSQGMPVLAFDCKGPKDIIQSGRNGYLVAHNDDMAAQIVAHFSTPTRHAAMRQQARARVQDYQAEPIMQEFLAHLGLAAQIAETSTARTAA